MGSCCIKDILNAASAEVRKAPKWLRAIFEQNEALAKQRAELSTNSPKSVKLAAHG